MMTTSLRQWQRAHSLLIFIVTVVIIGITIIYVFISCLFLRRLSQYSDLESEGSWVIAGKRPPPQWPQQGNISIRNLTLTYKSTLPPVLHGVSCDISAGEKIGVVGRTGAGKTSLIAALFRLIEFSSGTILIDGQDILKVKILIL